MKILDLFAGLGGEQRRAAIEARGHEYCTLDIDPRFGCSITADIFKFNALPPADFIWASPGRAGRARTSRKPQPPCWVSASSRTRSS